MISERTRGINPGISRVLSSEETGFFETAESGISPFATVVETPFLRSKGLSGNPGTNGSYKKLYPIEASSPYVGEDLA